MAERRFPRPDADFAAWMNSYVTAVKAWWSAQGLDESTLTPLNEALATWNVAYPAHGALQAAAEAGRQEKDAARRVLEAAARPVTAFIQSFPATTNADRATIGITIRDPASRGDVPPASKPLVLVSDAGRFTHRVRLLDEGHGHGSERRATRRARPRGVERAEVFVAFTPVGEAPPADFHAFRYVQSVSDGGAVLSFDSPRGGMTAHYLARWVTRRGAIGPWSETASATVAA